MNTILNELITEYKQGCEGKKIINLSMQEDGKYWQLDLDDGSYIGFELAESIKGVACNWMPNDKSEISPQAPPEISGFSKLISLVNSLSNKTNSLSKNG